MNTHTHTHIRGILVEVKGINFGMKLFSALMLVYPDVFFPLHQLHARIVIFLSNYEPKIS